MRGKHLTKNDFIDMPWKNGRGMTTELFRFERGQDLLCRISSAEVSESGPFSDFSGFDRTLVNLGPGAMTLTHDGVNPLPLGVHSVAHFDGAAKTNCQIDRPLRDFNVFSARGRVFATTVVRNLKALEMLPVPASSAVFIYAVSGTVTVKRDGIMDVSIIAGEAFLGLPDDDTNPARLSLSPATQAGAVMIVVLFREMSIEDAR